MGTDRGWGLVVSTVGLFLVGSSLSGCGSEPFAALPDSGTLGWGSSFGECIGYCREELTVTRDQIQLVVMGWHPTDPVPPRTHTGPTTREAWAALQRMVAFSEIEDLREVYGCPDCTDGGAEWVELDVDGESKRVTFEFGDPPRELEDLVRGLRAIRDQFSSSFFPLEDQLPPG